MKTSKAICSHCGRRHPPTCKTAGAGRGSGNRKARPHHLPTPQAGAGLKKMKASRAICSHCGRRHPLTCKTAGAGRGSGCRGECRSPLATWDASNGTGHPANIAECEHRNRSPRKHCEMLASAPVILLVTLDASAPTGHPANIAKCKRPHRSSCYQHRIQTSEPVIPLARRSASPEIILLRQYNAAEPRNAA